MRRQKNVGGLGKCASHPSRKIATISQYNLFDMIYPILNCHIQKQFNLDANANAPKLEKGLQINKEKPTIATLAYYEGPGY
mmetsp:Transcript_19177/g.29096  ORF Transcript_19177/g.29096 Transcript_19177/m.29096 type:complete len:81 (+) Transcript_19177:61-303(+)